MMSRRSLEPTLSSQKCQADARQKQRLVALRHNKKGHTPAQLRVVSQLGLVGTWQDDARAPAYCGA